MVKQATKFPHGKIHLSGRDIPLTKSGGLNMRYLTLEEKKIYLEHIEHLEKAKTNHVLINILDLDMYLKS